MIFVNGIKIVIFFCLFSLPDGMESSIVGPENSPDVLLTLSECLHCLVGAYS